MRDRINFMALVRRHRELGYSLTASIRLTLWCLDPEATLYPEKNQ